MHQQIKHLRFRCNWLGATAQFASHGIKHVIGKAKLHLASPSGIASTRNQAHLNDKSTAQQSLLLPLSGIFGYYPARFSNRRTDLHSSRLSSIPQIGPTNNSEINNRKKRWH